MFQEGGNITSTLFDNLIKLCIQFCACKKKNQLNATPKTLSNKFWKICQRHYILWKGYVT